MNIAKIIATILATAFYTSFIWGTCIFGNSSFREVFIVPLIFSSLGLVTFLTKFFVDNWDK